MCSRGPGPKRPAEFLIFPDFLLEAPPGFEPGIRVLQTPALPLGHGAAGPRSVRGGKVAAETLQRVGGYGGRAQASIFDDEGGANVAKSIAVCSDSNGENIEATQRVGPT